MQVCTIWQAFPQTGTSSPNKRNTEMERKNCTSARYHYYPSGAVSVSTPQTNDACTTK